MSGVNGVGVEPDLVLGVKGGGVERQRDRGSRWTGSGQVEVEVGTASRGGCSSIVPGGGPNTPVGALTVPGAGVSPAAYLGAGAGADWPTFASCSGTARNGNVGAASRTGSDTGRRKCVASSRRAERTVRLRRAPGVRGPGPRPTQACRRAQAGRGAEIRGGRGAAAEVAATGAAGRLRRRRRDGRAAAEWARACRWARCSACPVLSLRAAFSSCRRRRGRGRGRPQDLP